MKDIEKLQRVINSGLCNRCGTCVGLSDGKIRFKDKTGVYLPEIIAEPPANLANKIWQACSGKGFNFPEYQQHVFPDDNNFHVYLGSYKNIFIGHCVDEEIRRQAASGGIISAILIWLLENGRIDGAVVLGMSDQEPWLTQPFIARSRAEIMAAAQSKYTISSVNEILPEIASFQGQLAFVGLPGQIQSIRTLQAMNEPAVKNIRYLFGPFYGNSLHFSSVSSFLRSHGEKDYNQIKKLYFRYGEWPGYMRVEMRNGRIIELSKFHANYLIPFHILKNSLLCTDLSNEFTDISGGDAWAPVYEERGKGFSMVIARTTAGQLILDEMVGAGFLSLQPIAEHEAITMHSHGYDLKKRGAFIRIWFRKLLGKEVPDYGYELGGFSVSRYLMEAVITFLFAILSTSLARFIVELIPPPWMGRLFEKARHFWKKSTYQVKRSELVSNPQSGPQSGLQSGPQRDTDEAY
jgi:coenzyme F420 hydrogenase subunit beta